MAEQELQVILLFRPPSPISLARPLAPSPSRKGGIRGGPLTWGPSSEAAGRRGVLPDRGSGQPQSTKWRTWAATGNFLARS